jgi:CRP-like cAMP-binding protein
MLLLPRRGQLPRKATNLILDALPDEVRARLVAHLESVELPILRMLSEVGSELDYIYFPRSCVLSLLGVAETGEAVETAAIGREGAFGLVTGLQSRRAYARCVVQYAGYADRILALDFKREFDHDPYVREVVMRYIEALLIQFQQSTLCSTLHPARCRLARWLLTMNDRADSSTLLLTQEFLAEMLGLSRTTVTSAARSLQAASLITYRRGRIRIRDRAGLERTACECYHLLRAHFERLLPHG